MIDIDQEQALVPTQIENLVQETHGLLQKKRELEGNYVETIIKIGQNLNEMKEYGDNYKSYGQFLPWVKSEFDINSRTAQDYMRIAIVYGSNTHRGALFPERVLRVLAAPSTTAEVRQLVESGHIAATPEAIREANRARKALKKVEQWSPEEQIVESTIETSEIIEELELIPETDLCKILDACPISELHKYVEAGSLDAIITDPPYPRDYLSVYSDLADFAIHALKDGGSLIAMVGQYYLPDILAALQKGPLKYHWLSCYYIPGDTAKIWHRRIGASWKPLIWFVKGKYTGPWKKDVIKDEGILDDDGQSEDIFVGNGKDKKHHEWGQPVHDMVNIIEHFTQPDQLVCDPFLGGGTTALASIMCERRFIGSDINQQCVDTTRKRVKETSEALQGE